MDDHSTNEKNCLEQELGTIVMKSPFNSSQVNVSSAMLSEKLRTTNLNMDSSDILLNLRNKKK